METYFFENLVFKTGVKDKMHPLGQPTRVPGTANFRFLHNLMHVLKTVEIRRKKKALRINFKNLCTRNLKII